ncbi:MAG: DUF6295 family protein [Chloroflexota bacterium]
MCSWITEKTGIMAHGKGVSEWMPLTTANVYYDHPVSAPLDHALSIDFLNEAAGPGARVAVELSAESARALVRAIEAALAAGELHCHDTAPAARDPASQA